MTNEQLADLKNELGRILGVTGSYEVQPAFGKALSSALNSVTQEDFKANILKAFDLGDELVVKLGEILDRIEETEH